MLYDMELPGILDKAIDNPEGDKFGHELFSSALERLIESDKLFPPYSIGLLGPWGTGKSSIKSLYINSLNQDITKKDKIKTISFNAWRYGGNTDLKRALLRHVYLELGGKCTTFWDEVRNTFQKRTIDEKSLKSALNESIELLLHSLFPVIGIMTFIVIIFLIIFNSILGSDLILYSASASILLLGIIGYLVNNWIKTYIETYNQTILLTRIENPKTSVEEYEELLIEQIDKWKEDCRNFERLVIFIDDLDRLSAHEMVEGLDAIRTFMELPLKKCENSHFLGIIFVISCDDDRIAEAIKNRNRKGELPGVIFTHEDARRYLDRIFQFRLEIPPFPKMDMRNYAKELLQKVDPKITNEIQNSGNNISVLIDYLIPSDITNPRNAIQLVNSFTHSFWFAKNRESLGELTDNPGGLLKGTLTNHPYILACFSVLKVNFPDFYKELLEDPNLLKVYMKAVFYKQIDENININIKKFLEKYDESNSNSNAQENHNNSVDKIKNNNGSLRRYLANFRGFEWPDSLQPFLFFSEDLITRKYSSKGVNPYDELSSGDVDGFLEKTGLILNSRSLHNDEIVYYRNIIEEIAKESELRRENAAFVIISISNRIPEEGTNSLILPAFTLFFDSPSFISRVGLDKIKELVDRVPSEYQQKIVDILLSKSINGKYFNIKPNPMENLTLDTAMKMSEIIVDISLKVWKNYNISIKSQNLLSNWLLKRSITLENGNSNSFSIVFLENRLTQYEEILLPLLKEKYSEIIIQEIIDERIDQIDISVCLKRFDKIYDLIIESSNYDKSIILKQLTQLVSVQNEEAVLFSLEYVKNHWGIFEVKNQSQYLSEIILRIKKDWEDDEEEKWTLNDWEEVTSTFIDLYNKCASYLPEESIKHLALITSFSLKNDVSVEYGIKLFSILHDVSVEECSSILNDLIQEIWTDVPDETIKWLGNYYDKLLNQEQITHIRSKLDELTSKDSIDPNLSEKYKKFLDSLTYEGIKSDSISQHISNIYTSIYRKYKYFNNYGIFLLPILVQNEKISTCLKNEPAILNLFQGQNIPIPDFIKIHSFFIGYWKNFFKTLNPTQIFNHSAQIIQNNININGVDQILVSINELLQFDILKTDENEKIVSNLSCDIFPFYPTLSSQIIQSHLILPDEGKIIAMLNSLNSNELDSKQNFEKIWKYVANKQSNDDRRKIDQILISQGQIIEDQNQIYAAQLWFDIKEEDIRQKDLINLLKTHSLIEREQLIIFRLFLKNIELLEYLIISDYIVFLLNQGPDKTINLIDENLKLIEDSFKTAEERSHFSELLFNELLVNKIENRLKLISTILKDIGGLSFLKKIGTKRYQITTQQLDIFIELFPSEKKMLERKREKIKE